VTKQTLLVAGLIAASSAAVAQSATKVGIIHIQSAIVSTKEGQEAAKQLQAKFDPKRKSLEAKQDEIRNLQTELSKGSNTMAEAKRLQLTRDIDAKTKSLNRDTEDAQAEFEQEQGRLLNDIGGRMMVVIEKYAKDNGFSLLLDVSSPQTSVLYAASGVDVTKEIIELYDKNAPSAAAPAAPAKPTAAPAKPTAAPAKKQ